MDWMFFSVLIAQLVLGVIAGFCLAVAWEERSKR